MITTILNLQLLVIYYYYSSNAFCCDVFYLDLIVLCVIFKWIHLVSTIPLGKTFVKAFTNYNDNNLYEMMYLDIVHAQNAFIYALIRLY